MVAPGWLNGDVAPVDDDTAVAVFGGAGEVVWGDRVELGAGRAKAHGVGEVVWGDQLEPGPVRPKRR